MPLDRSLVHQHRGIGRLGDQMPLDMRLAEELPHAEPIALLGDVDAQRVAGHPRAAEAGAVDADEIDELAFRAAAQRLNDEDGGGLRHRLDDQHARHHRALGEVAGEIGFVDRHVLDPDGTRIGDDLDDPVDHQERVAMRDHRANALDIEIRHPALLVGRIHLSALLPREPLEQRYTAPKFLRWQRRKAADRLARRDIAKDAAMRRHPRSLAQCQVTGQAALPTDHDEIVELGAARDANLRDDHATPANNDVVPDLHQIINHRAVADHRVEPGTAVDRGIGADLDIVADDDAAELRHPDMTAGIRREAEAFLSDTRPRQDAHPIADQAVAEADIGADPRRLADDDALANHAIGVDPAVAADRRLGADADMVCELATRAETGAGIDDGARRDRR